MSFNDGGIVGAHCQKEGAPPMSWHTDSIVIFNTRTTTTLQQLPDLCILTNRTNHRQNATATTPQKTN